MTSISSGEAAKARSRARTSSTPDAVRDGQTEFSSRQTHTWIGVDDDAVEGSSHLEPGSEIMPRCALQSVVLLSGSLRTQVPVGLSVCEVHNDAPHA